MLIVPFQSWQLEVAVELAQREAAAGGYVIAALLVCLPGLFTRTHWCPALPSQCQCVACTAMGSAWPFRVGSVQSLAVPDTWGRHCVLSWMLETEWLGRWLCPHPSPQQLCPGTSLSRTVLSGFSVLKESCQILRATAVGAKCGRRTR